MAVKTVIKTIAKHSFPPVAKLLQKPLVVNANYGGRATIWELLQGLFTPSRESMTTAIHVSLLLLVIFAVCSHVTDFTSARNFLLRRMGVRLLVKDPFYFEEATISDIQVAFKNGSLNSSQLVKHYLDQIRALNPILNAVLEINPDAIDDAAKADLQRNVGGNLSTNNLYFPLPLFCCTAWLLVHLFELHGIPILIKDNISTRGKLNTTSGSFALLGSVVSRDAGVIQRLRRAGAIILGKASMSEWDNFRSLEPKNGWCPRGGQGRNPYPSTDEPCGSSSGSAIAVAANLVTVSLGTDLDNAITCPAILNSVVGIKPTVGLTSRSGMVPISPRLQTIGPMARTMADTVTLLDVIVGFHPLDANATNAATRFIPIGGFHKSLKEDGLKGKRLGILRRQFSNEYQDESVEAKTFASHFQTIRLKGAILVDNIEMKNVEIMQNMNASGEVTLLLAEFKLSLNAYLKDLESSPERMKEYGQIIFLASQQTSGIGDAEKIAIKRMAQLSKEGMEDLIQEKSLDAVVFPGFSLSHAMAIGGFPIISVPAGYNNSSAPFGISFAGLRGSDATLIEIAYAFEQATKVRKLPSPLI
ncbi:hypothetical protein IEQ34_019872 [Dendrobium chrysotoxum]|uniref:Amidase domain-containing protein n=1 Tax=Dendrobium chrysotoxum TaxID=161865 RepID=A0AAV7G9P0_DENCH|nr:hypothetical protein IEQ34_019872 [Dendrobium chrysotoxum]